MRAGKLLIAALVAAGATAAGAAHDEPRARGDAHAHAPAPRVIDAPAPAAFHFSRHDRHAVPGNRGRDGYWILPHGLSPYKAEIDRNGWFLHWEDRYGNVIVPNRRFGPPAPPSPYHVPVVDANGWFMHWQDMSGDVSTHPFHAAGRGRESSD